MAPTFSHTRLLHRTREFSLNPEYVMDYTELGPIRTQRRTSAARRVTEIDKTSTFASPLLSAQAGGKGRPMPAGLSMILFQIWNLGHKAG
jgi:hypothetical protein